MNVFEILVGKLEEHYEKEPDLAFRSAHPLERSGFWTCSLVFADNFLVSLAWNRHHGFMLTAGFDIAFGDAYDEIFELGDDVFDRITFLVKDRSATDFQQPLSLAVLRKLHGVSQMVLADRLEITKGGLSQLEREDDLLGMKVGTINKLIDSLGGRLVLTAKFPNGDERHLSIY